MGCLRCGRDFGTAVPVSGLCAPCENLAARIHNIEEIKIPVQNFYGGLDPADWKKLYDKINEIIERG